MHDTPDSSQQPLRQIKHRYAFDAMMMFLYTTIVHVWGLRVYPLGRDYACMASPGDLPFLADRLFAWELGTFGANVVPYHLVNLALLYACMLCIYHFTRFVMRGPAWFGTLAATMFMAMPVHSEAVLNLCGVGDLLPCLVALAALTAYTAPREGKVLDLIALALFALAVVPYGENVGLFLVLVLFELLGVPEGTRRPLRLLPFGVVAVVGWCLNAEVLRASNLDPARMFAPLYFLFYPIGLLPETARQLYVSPWLGWLGATAVVVIVALIYRKARRPAILFGLLGMLAVRLFQGGAAIDPVHMVGGGQLLLANALFNIALAALFRRMMDHPKWRRPVVVITTFICLVLFGLQIRSNRVWACAADQVQAWQARALSLAEEDPDRPVYLAPDCQYDRGAPMCLGEALRHDTPFSESVDTFSLFPMHYPKARNVRITCEHWLFGGVFFRVVGARPIDLVCWPYTFAKENDTSITQDTVLKLYDVKEDSFVISSRPKEGSLPLKEPATVPPLH